MSGDVEFVVGLVIGMVIGYVRLWVWIMRRKR